MRSFLLVITCILLPVPGISTAQDVEAAMQCRHYVEDEKRLACYDRTMEGDRGAVALKPAPQPQQASDTDDEALADVNKDDTGKWNVSVDRSRMTDQTNVFVRLSSNDKVRHQYTHQGNGYAELWLRCMENTTAILVTMDGEFLTDNQSYGRVEYRVGESKMASVRMNASTDNKALGLWSGRSAIPFIKKLLGQDKLLLRITPYNESSQTMAFDISGVDTAVDGLRKECGW